MRIEGGGSGQGQAAQNLQASWAEAALGLGWRSYGCASRGPARAAAAAIVNILPTGLAQTAVWQLHALAPQLRGRSVECFAGSSWHHRQGEPLTFVSQGRRGGGTGCWHWHWRRLIFPPGPFRSRLNCSLLWAFGCIQIACNHAEPLPTTTHGTNPCGLRCCRWCAMWSSSHRWTPPSPRRTARSMASPSASQTVSAGYSGSRRCLCSTCVLRL